MANHRKTRLEGELRRKIALLIMEGRIKDPLLARANLVSVTRVEVAGDLSQAKVFVSVYGGDSAKEGAEPSTQDPAARAAQLEMESEKNGRKVVSGLNRAAGYIQHELASSIRMRRLPTLQFVLDRAVAEGDAMIGLLEAEGQIPEASFGEVEGEFDDGFDGGLGGDSEEIGLDFDGR